MKTIPDLDRDEQTAERIGRRLAESFGLSFANESTQTRPLYQTPDGTFSNKGIARRTLLFLQDRF